MKRYFFIKYGKRTYKNNCFRTLCRYCKKKILKENWFKKWKNHFCNMHCYNLFKEKTEIFKNKQRPKGWKHTEEAKSKLSLSIKGDKCCMWQGGKSIQHKIYGGFFSKQLKDKIRVRDKFICQKCGIPELELTRRLLIHHIDKNPKNCSEENLMSVCKSCHIKIHQKDLHSGINIRRKEASFKIKRYIKDKFNNRCVFCGNNEKIIIHHIDNNSFNNIENNLQLVCRKCHYKIHFKKEVCHQIT